MFKSESVEQPFCQFERSTSSSRRTHHRNSEDFHSIVEKIVQNG